MGSDFCQSSTVSTIPRDMICFQTRLAPTSAKRSFCGAVMRAARRSRVSEGFSASCLPVSVEIIFSKGHAGLTVVPGFSVTSMSDLRPPWWSLSMGTEEVVGTLIGEVWSIAAISKRSCCK